MAQLADFKNLPELIKHFSEERVCWDYLEQQLWGGKPICPHCGSIVAYRMLNYKQFHCGNKKGCNKKFTVLVGSMYENTKIPLAKWFAAIWLITAHKKGISSCQLARDISITQRSAWFLLHRIRKMVSAHNNITLDKTVQMDESYYKGVAKNRSIKKRIMIAQGKIEDKPTIIFAIVNDEKAVMRVVENTERKTLKYIVNDVIPDKETTIVTDAFQVYHGLDMVYKKHVMVNHAQGEYKKDGYFTNTVEGLFGYVKRGLIGIYHFASKKHMQAYLEEFSYKYNSRKIKDSERFILTIQKSKGRLKYSDLVKKA